MMITREGGVWGKGEADKRGNYMVIEGGWIWGGEHTVEYSDAIV